MRAGSGGNLPTADAVLVARTGTRSVYRAVASETRDEYDRLTRILTCGHEPGSNRARRDGRFPCYECTVLKAKEVAEWNAQPTYESRHGA